MKYKILPFLLISLFVCNSAKAQTWQMKQAPLMTEFAADVDPNNTLAEYPRPQCTNNFVFASSVKFEIRKQAPWVSKDDL